MNDFGNCKNSVGLKLIAVRLRQTRSSARFQALAGNVFRGGSATYELNRRQSRQEHVPRQSLGTSDFMGYYPTFFLEETPSCVAFVNFWLYINMYI